GHDGVGVALRHRPEAVVEVEVLVAVDVPDPLPLAVVEVDRPRLAQLVRGSDAAGEGPAGALPHLPRAGRALVQGRAFAGDQLRDAGAVEVDRGRRRRRQAGAASGTTSPSAASGTATSRSRTGFPSAYPSRAMSSTTASVPSVSASYLPRWTPQVPKKSYSRPVHRSIVPGKTATHDPSATQPVISSEPAQIPASPNGT